MARSHVPFHPAMCFSLHFRVGQSPGRSLTALRHWLSPVSFCRFFFPSLSWPENPNFAPFIGDFFFPLCSYLLFRFSGEALNLPHKCTEVHTRAHASQEENKHTRLAECVCESFCTVCGWDMSKWLHALQIFTLTLWTPEIKVIFTVYYRFFAINTQISMLRISGGDRICSLLLYFIQCYPTLLVFYTKLISFFRTDFYSIGLTYCTFFFFLTKWQAMWFSSVLSPTDFNCEQKHFEP